MHVIVVGGGISGLTLALSLHELGIDVRVYESSPQNSFLGLGIQVQPNAVRELIALGLGDGLAQEGIAITALKFFNRHGQTVWSEPRGIAAGYRWPQYNLPRGDLQRLLHETAVERLGPERIVAGHHLSSFELKGDGVVARFVDRDTGRDVDTVEGDILVGADGIHSTVRRSFYPEDKPRYDGVVRYRGVVDSDRFLDGSTSVIVGHRHQRVIAYPMSRRHADRGRSTINWLCSITAPEDASLREDWTLDADKNLFLPLYKDWRLSWFDIPALIARTEQVFQFPSYDRDPLPRWSFGRVTMIGDAAHPMLPIAGQAGSQAIVDARILAAELRAGDDPVEALRRFQDLRIATMNGVTVRNRNFGPETVLQLAEERAPDGFDDIHDILTRDELDEAANSFKRAAGLDIESVNRVETLVPAANP